MRRRIEFIPAFVLSQRPYRESSLLVELFSETEGRVGLVARAARGPKSRQRALLQPFVPLLVSWVESGDLGTLAAVEAAGPAITPAGERVFHGWYVNELLLKLMQRHDAHRRLYHRYEATLRALNEADDEPALRRFELDLLAELGYGLDLEADFDAAARYCERPGGGFTAAAPTQREAVSGAALLALRDDRLEHADPAQRREIRRLLRAALQRQLGDRKLETPQLLRALRAKLAHSD